MTTSTEILARLREIAGVEDAFMEGRYSYVIFKGHVFEWGPVDDAVRHVLATA